jgi:GTP-binding protein
VLYKTDSETGKKLEPIEEVQIDVDDMHMGTVIDKLKIRKGELVGMKPGTAGRTMIDFTCPSRGLVGYRSIFMTDTHGTGILNRAFLEYGKFRGSMEAARKGVLVSMALGPTTLYSLGKIEPRGTLFVGEGVEVYEGMIIGEASRGDDIDLNPVKPKELTNIRAAGMDEKIRLVPPRRYALEEALGYVQEDELIEITPTAIRMRKRVLNSRERKNSGRAGARANKK